MGPLWHAEGFPSTVNVYSLYNSCYLPASASDTENSLFEHEQIT